MLTYIDDDLSIDLDDIFMISHFEEDYSFYSKIENERFEISSLQYEIIRDKIKKINEEPKQKVNPFEPSEHYKKAAAEAFHNSKNYFESHQFRSYPLNMCTCIASQVMPCPMHPKGLLHG